MWGKAWSHPLGQPWAWCWGPHWPCPSCAGLSWRCSRKLSGSGPAARRNQSASRCLHTWALPKVTATEDECIGVNSMETKKSHKEPTGYDPLIGDAEPVRLSSCLCKLAYRVMTRQKISSKEHHWQWLCHGLLSYYVHSLILQQEAAWLTNMPTPTFSLRWIVNSELHSSCCT